MVVSGDIANMTEEQLIVMFRKQGYSKEASEYLAGKLSGRIEDGNQII